MTTNHAPYSVRRAAFFDDYFQRFTRHLSAVDDADLNRIVSLLAEVKGAGGKVIVAGNGGSAAMASHVSVDLTKAATVRSISFNEADLITCFANDYGYEQWVAKAIEAYGDPADAAILISSSGQSKNITNAAVTARKAGLKVITLSGFAARNPLRELGDVNLWVDSSEYNIVEMVHHTWLVAIVDKIVQDNTQAV